jgi:hypothetical protein
LGKSFKFLRFLFKIKTSSCQKLTTPPWWRVLCTEIPPFAFGALEWPRSLSVYELPAGCILEPFSCVIPDFLLTINTRTLDCAGRPPHLCSLALVNSGINDHPVLTKGQSQPCSSEGSSEKNVWVGELMGSHPNPQVSVCLRVTWRARPHCQGSVSAGLKGKRTCTSDMSPGDAELLALGHTSRTTDLE